ncbi:competence protein ComK [Geobacillus subterraneus]|uniref:competence protein ComK n=1 Tax=Geobacillus subterraneus TaxID=129338 RepID=UPI001442E40C|nr:competence protein ComK [Geobacillus subterraneus]QIZ69127.1 hypothetical protein HF500_18065 [Geobacillus subterraneus]
MDWKEVKKFTSTGQAFVPVNVEGRGDSVELFFKNGETQQLDMQCSLFLKQLLTFFGTSVSINRHRYGELVGKKQLVPIVLSYGFTIIPFNVRQPIGRQSRVGWFVSREIERFQQRSHQFTLVHLSSGHQVPVLHSRKFCLDQLKNAKWIEMCYGEIHEPHRRQWMSGSVACETAIM